MDPTCRLKGASAVSDSNAKAVRCRANTNVPVVCYFGTLTEWPDERLPTNPSLSLTVNVGTECFVQASPLEEDLLVIGDQPPRPDARVSRLLEQVRAIAGVAGPCLLVQTHNQLPTGSGLGTSASAFAAIARAAVAYYEVTLSDRDFSILVRRQSGSACRSCYGGWVEWRMGVVPEASFPVQVAEETHWPTLRLLAVIVSEKHKPIGSTEAMKRAQRSPLFSARLAETFYDIEYAREAIRRRDLAMLGAIAERQSMILHATAMNPPRGKEPIVYWQPATLRVWHTVQALRAQECPAYASIQAGPNVVIWTDATDLEAVRTHISSLPDVLSVIVLCAGPGPYLVSQNQS